MCSEIIKILHSWNLRNNIFVISFKWHLHHVCLSNHYALRGWLQQFEQILFWILCSVIFHLVQWGACQLMFIAAGSAQYECFNCSLSKGVYHSHARTYLEEMHLLKKLLLSATCHLPCFSCLLVDLFFFSFVCIHLMFYWKWRYGSAHCTCRLVNQRLQEFHWFLQF